MQRLGRGPTTAAVAVLAALVGCGDSSATEPSIPDPQVPPSPELPWPANEFPPLPDSMKDVPEARIELGKTLFYDPILSVDGETTCGTCHSEFWGMSDALPRSVGHGAGLVAGPDRRGPNVLRRNSPTLFNMAFRSSFFFDGRTATLEEQAILPLLAEDEFDRDPEQVIADLAALPEYVDLFASAFPDDPRVTLDHFATALADFQRTLISNRSVYDGYVDGDVRALSEDMVDGMFRFAELGCSDCHVPPLFESETFADRGVPEIDGVVDEGLAEHTGNPADRGKFRTVTLRNVAFTEPYFHNGSIRSLEEAVLHELEQTGTPYSEEDARLITSFVRALRDETRRPQRPTSVPSGLSLPIDERR